MTNWGTPYAGMINGTEGTLFHPGVSRNDTLYVFVDQLFRSGYFTYQKDVEQYGIQLYRFVLPPEELKNSTQDPGFYPYGLNGVLNLTAVFPLSESRGRERGGRGREGGIERGRERGERELFAQCTCVFYLHLLYRCSDIRQ